MHTYHLGIDVAKAKLDCALLRPDGKYRNKVVENNLKGFNVLTAWLKKQAATQPHVCMEATGIYWEAVAGHLPVQGMTVSVINPAQLKAFGKSRLVRTKTDKNADGKSVHLPTHLFNKFGYNIEFDEKGNYNGLKIDFDALAAHIVQLHKEAKKQGHDLWRVIFDPELQPQLFKTKYANYLKENIVFSSKRSWVRHDEHYHVDFLIPCNEK